MKGRLLIAVEYLREYCTYFHIVKSCGAREIPAFEKLNFVPARNFFAVRFSYPIVIELNPKIRQATKNLRK